jgi:hypothetical protein
MPSDVLGTVRDRLAYVNAAPAYLVRDNDGAYGQAFRRRVRTMGIRDRPTSPRSPWQNPYAERLIGTLRHDCSDHILIFGARHLRRTLTTYSSYHNESRTHLSLDKDAPLHRAVQRCGTIVATPILSGLHHYYARYDFREGQGSAASRHCASRLEYTRAAGPAERCELVRQRARCFVWPGDRRLPAEGTMARDVRTAKYESPRRSSGLSVISCYQSRYCAGYKLKSDRFLV